MYSLSGGISYEKKRPSFEPRLLEVQEISSRLFLNDGRGW